MSSGRLLLSFIHSWYTFKEIVEEIDEFLKPSLEERGNLSLILFISTLEGKWVIEKYRILAKEYETCIFATSLIGATIQDRGKSERSD